MIAVFRHCCGNLLEVLTSPLKGAMRRSGKTSDMSSTLERCRTIWEGQRPGRITKVEVARRNPDHARRMADAGEIVLVARREEMILVEVSAMKRPSTTAERTKDSELLRAASWPDLALWDMPSFRFGAAPCAVEPKNQLMRRGRRRRQLPRKELQEARPALYRWKNSRAGSGREAYNEGFATGARKTGFHSGHAQKGPAGITQPSLKRACELDKGHGAIA